MWKLNKPELNKVFSDIEKIEERKIVIHKDANSLKQLATEYDTQGGHVTDYQLSSIPAKVANNIKSHYTDTNSKKPLEYIREDLFDGVSRCPYCSIGQVNTLDHYMPKDNYPAMSLCRLNLVPICWECNHTKGTKSYKEFIHPYYKNLPTKTIFLQANITVHLNQIIIDFYFDKAAVNNLPLYDELCKHWKNLKMNERLSKAAIDYIHNEIIDDYSDDNQCIESIRAQLKRKEKKYGPNDWRTAILRALLSVIQGSEKDNFLKSLQSTIKNKSDQLI